MLTSGTDLLQDILRGRRAARASSCLTSGVLSRLVSSAWPSGHQAWSSHNPGMTLFYIPWLPDIIFNGSATII